MRKLLVIALVVAALVIAGCANPGTTPSSSQGSAQFTAAGSTTVQPLAEKLAAAFTAQNPNVRIDVQGGGSSVGVKSAANGSAEVGMASRDVSQAELAETPDLVVWTIARDGIAVVANPDVAVNNLTVDQVRDIFDGQITNWKDVGGPDQVIAVVSREEGSGTRSAFEELVMGKDALITADAILLPSNGAIRTTVSTTPNSVGYISFGYLDSSVTALAINGVPATAENALSGAYPVVRPLNMLTLGQPTGAVKEWLDFILSPAGQAIVAEEGYIAVK